MKVTLSQLIKVDRFMDRCGLSFVNNLVNSLLKIYLRCTGKESLTGSTLKREWSIYVKQKDAASCAAGFIPVLGSIFIVAKERFNENRADAAMGQLIEEHPHDLADCLKGLDETEKEQLSYSSIYSDYLVQNNLHDQIRFDQRLPELQRLDEALEHSMYSDIENLDSDDAVKDIAFESESAQIKAGQERNIQKLALLGLGEFFSLEN